MGALTLKLLGWRGIVGLGVALVLSVLLVVQKGETRHWRRESNRYEQLYRSEKSAFDTTVTNYRAAAARQKADEDAKNARTATQQQAVNKEHSDELEARLADARARYDRLRRASAADPGGHSGAPVSGVPAAGGQPSEAAGQAGLPPADALTATEQAIQLDELIKWVRAQHAIDQNGK